MKLDNYILMDRNKKIVICFFYVISFLSLVRTQDHFKTKAPLRGKLWGFFLIMATGLKHVSSNE